MFQQQTQSCCQQEPNEADHNSRHTGPSVAQENPADNQAEWTASDAEEVFDKDVRAVVQA